MEMALDTKKQEASYKILQGGFFNDTLRNWQSRLSKVTPDSLLYPIFISIKENDFEEIGSLPGQYRIGLNRLKDFLLPIVENGLKSVLLFAANPIKDDDIEEENTSIIKEKNPVLYAIGLLKKEFPSLTIACDVCLCAFKRHGHCGVVDEDCMLNNRCSVEQIAETAYAYVKAGCHIVAPSDMNDGRIQAICDKLRAEGLRNKVSILSYSAKFASSMYGPFRDAAGSAPKKGDRKCYQLPPGSSGLANRAVSRDIQEGADMLMVKPAMFYMDVIKETKLRFPDYPLAAYQVSGEYAMLYHASVNGALDLKRAVLESLVSLHRAGADILITYYTPSVLKWLKEE